MSNHIILDDLFISFTFLFTKHLQNTSHYFPSALFAEKYINWNFCSCCCQHYCCCQFSLSLPSKMHWAVTLEQQLDTSAPRTEKPPLISKPPCPLGELSILLTVKHFFYQSTLKVLLQWMLLMLQHLLLLQQPFVVACTLVEIAVDVGYMEYL